MNILRENCIKTGPENCFGFAGFVEGKILLYLFFIYTDYANYLRLFQRFLLLKRKVSDLRTSAGPDHQPGA